MRASNLYTTEVLTHKSGFYLREHISFSSIEIHKFAISYLVSFSLLCITKEYTNMFLNVEKLNTAKQMGCITNNYTWKSIKNTLKWMRTQMVILSNTS